VAKQILLVDDEVAICEALTAFLAEQGHQVRYATNGEGAVAQALHADLAICDLRLGSENGLDVIERLRRVRPELQDPRAHRLPVDRRAPDRDQSGRGRVPLEAARHQPTRRTGCA